MSVNFNNYYNKLSNSGVDERGQYAGGQAGDQGGEWTICDWYQYSWGGGWKCVLRYPDAKVRELIAELAIEAANNNKIGYDQDQRYTYWNQLQNSGYRPSKITVACEADCSAGVIANTKAAGYLLGVTALKNLNATYTGNMRSGFKAAGFQVLTDSKYLTSSAYLLPGDIILNDNYHTVTNLGIGSKTGTSSSSASTTVGKNTSKYSTKDVQHMLNLAGWSLQEDGVYGAATTAAVKEFQKLYELEADGYCGPKTAEVLVAVKAIVDAGFDATFYANTYADLKKAYGTDKKQLLHHYYKYGKKEGRKIHATTTTTSTTNTTTTTNTSASTSGDIPVNTTGKYNTTPLRKGIITADALNIRKGPGTNYGNLVSYPILYNGNEVDVCDKIKGTDGTYWYYIWIAHSKYGFASASYIKLTKY